jgi:shikimate kinase
VTDRAVVVLIGAPGAGKSRTGRRVAKLLGVPVIDTDKVIVAEHGPIADLFATRGEPAFRALERAAVRDALTQPAVVSLGGGAVLDPETQADLDGLPVVQLTMDLEAARERVVDPKRPLSSDPEAWARLVQLRQPVYDRLAGLTIDTSRRPLDGVAQQIADWLKERA